MNVRDLGGLPTEDGARDAAAACVVRADNVRRLTDDGWRALAEHGVRASSTCAGRRSSRKTRRARSTIEVVHVSVLGDGLRRGVRQRARRAPDAVDDVADHYAWSYVDFLERYRERFGRRSPRSPTRRRAPSSSTASAARTARGSSPRSLLRARRRRPRRRSAPTTPLTGGEPRAALGVWIARRADEEERAIGVAQAADARRRRWRAVARGDRAPLRRRRGVSRAAGPDATSSSERLRERLVAA